MKNDTLIRIEGMEVLMEKLGLVEAERFIMLLKREPFDYTKWRETHFNDKSLETIFAEAAALRAQTEKMKKVKQAKSRTSKMTTGRQKIAKRLAHA